MASDHQLPPKLGLGSYANSGEVAHGDALDNRHLRQVVAKRSFRSRCIERKHPAIPGKAQA
jgi:hypothetical protein